MRVRLSEIELIPSEGPSCIDKDIKYLKERLGEVEEDLSLSDKKKRIKTKAIKGLIVSLESFRD